MAGVVNFDEPVHFDLSVINETETATANPPFVVKENDGYIIWIEADKDLLLKKIQLFGPVTGNSTYRIEFNLSLKADGIKMFTSDLLALPTTNTRQTVIAEAITGVNFDMVFDPPFLLHCTGIGGLEMNNLDSSNKISFTYLNDAAPTTSIGSSQNPQNFFRDQQYILGGGIITVNIKTNAPQIASLSFETIPQNE